MSTININGKTYNFPRGKNVSVIDNVIYVDGKPFDPTNGELKGAPINVKIELTGSVDSIQGEATDVVVHGTVGHVQTMSGDVTVHGNVTGNVKTMSGDVDAGGIQGDVSTMSGDISRG